VSIVTLALGIGAATAIFSVIYNVLLAPFPEKGAERMVFALGYAAFGAFSMRVDSFLLAFAGALLLPGLGLAVSRFVFSRNTI
jgi:hypothetical protein